MLMLIVIYGVLGFCYAWTVGVVAREEIGIRAGVFVVILPLLARIALVFTPIQLGLIGLGIDFALLLLGAKLIARLEWKPALIVSAIYTVVLLAVYVFIALALS